MSEGLSGSFVGVVGEGGPAQTAGRRLAHASRQAETRTALSVQVGGCRQVSVLGRPEGRGEPDLGAGLTKKPVPKGPLDPHLERVRGHRDNRGRGRVWHWEDPLGGTSCSHLKLFSKMSFISRKQGEIVVQHCLVRAQLCCTHKAQQEAAQGHQL